MDELRPDKLAAAVAAWHNRHPLARRITPAQVQGIGWVALPFVQRPGAAPLAMPGLATVAGRQVPDDGSGEPTGAAASDTGGAPVATEATAATAATFAATAPEATAAPSTAAATRLPARLLIAFKQGLRAALAWPARLRVALDAARQRQARFRLRAQALQPAFSEDFIAPISPRQAARWALRHGQLQVHGGGLPVREVRPDAQWGRQDTGLVTLYLATAAVEAGSRRARVLLPADGSGAPRGTLGPRLMSPPRAVAALGLLAAVGLGLVGPVLADWPGLASAQAVLARWSAPSAGGAASEPAAPADGAEQLASAASVASAASATAASSAASTVASAASAAAPGTDRVGAASPAASGAASAPGEALLALVDAASAPAAPLPSLPSPARTAEPPASAAVAALAAQGPPAAPLPLRGADPDGGATTLPPDDPPPATVPQAEPFRPGQRLVRPLDEATKAAARQTVAALRAARGDPPPPPLSAAAPLALAPNLASPPQAGLGPEPGPAYALTTRPLRTRAESEQVQIAVRALLAQHTAEPLLVELMPAGDDWRVVCWPFTRRQDAQLARALLLTRGLRMEAVEF